MHKFKFLKGFTLIELLVVIGLLAVIAAGVIALINPVEKNRQALDSKVFNDIGQSATALQSIAATSTDGAYPCRTNAAGCINTQVTMVNLTYLGAGANASGELQTVPTAPNAGAAPYGAYDYWDSGAPSATRPTNFVLYGKLGSAKYNSQCPAGSPNAYYVYDTTVGRACIKCFTNAQSPPTSYANANIACSITL